MRPRRRQHAARMSQRSLDVRPIAQLARLELTDEEAATFQPQLEAILRQVDMLAELDLDGIEPTAHPVPLAGPMREDLPHTSLSPEDALRNAPDASAGQFRVPKVVADA